MARWGRNGAPVLDEHLWEDARPTGASFALPTRHAEDHPGPAAAPLTHPMILERS